MKPLNRVHALRAAAAVLVVAVVVGIVLHRVRRAESPAPPSVSAEPEVADLAYQEQAPANTPTLAPLPSDTDVRAYVREARRYIEHGEPAAAESLLAAVVVTHPAHATAWNVLGRSRLALGDEAGARDAFQHACDVDSTHAWARNNLGWIRLQGGDWRSALPLLEAAVRLDNDVAVFHNNLAVAYERARRFEDAAREYARALELQPSHATAAAALARAQSRAAAAESLAVAPATSDSGAAVITPPLATRDSR